MSLLPLVIPGLQLQTFVSTHFCYDTHRGHTEQGDSLVLPAGTNQHGHSALGGGTTALAQLGIPFGISRDERVPWSLACQPPLLGSQYSTYMPAHAGLQACQLLQNTHDETDLTEDIVKTSRGYV